MRFTLSNTVIQYRDKLKKVPILRDFLDQVVYFIVLKKDRLKFCLKNTLKIRFLIKKEIRNGLKAEIILKCH